MRLEDGGRRHAVRIGMSQRVGRVERLRVDGHLVGLESKRSSGRRSIVSGRLRSKGGERGRVGIKEGGRESEGCSTRFRSRIQIVPVGISHILVHTVHGVAHAADVAFVGFLFQIVLTFRGPIFHRKVLFLESGDKVSRGTTTRLFWSTTINTTVRRRKRASTGS